MEEKKDKERCLLIGVKGIRTSKLHHDVTLNELELLTDTAGGKVIDKTVADLKRISPATYIHSGKVEEIAELCREQEINLVVFDEELSPSQQKNLENAFKVPVIDRTGLILDIFSQRARTKEGKLQVELAQLEYRLPRLTRMWEHLSRLGGGIGTRGPGETQLEVDRRSIRRKIFKVKKEIEKVKKHRELYRRKRRRISLTRAALIGYTNAGKSTVFNALTNLNTFTEDKLFATLDPLTRKVSPENGSEFLVTDTVGFIRKLPHQLIAAFMATLEEVKEADLLLHVVDAHDLNFTEQMESVDNVLRLLDADGKYTINIYNKRDLMPEDSSWRPDAGDPRGVFVSALKNEGMDELMDKIEIFISSRKIRIKLRLPFEKGDVLSRLKERNMVENLKYLEEGIELVTEVDRSVAMKLSEYIVDMP